MESTTQSEFQTKMSMEKKFYPQGIKKEHIYHIKSGLRKLISSEAIIEPSSSTFNRVYPYADLLINSVQASTMG